MKKELYAMMEDVRTHQYKNLTGKIGCVYPDNEESYYIHSNLGHCQYIDCIGGSFYAEVNYDEE